MGKRIMNTVTRYIINQHVKLANNETHYIELSRHFSAAAGYAEYERLKEFGFNIVLIQTTESTLELCGVHD